MSNKTYDIIKTVSLLAAPVLTFVAALVSIWGLPYSAQITATLAAIDTMLGGLVVISKAMYDKKEGDK